jgi:L-carnitine CoA-transferase
MVKGVNCIRNIGIISQIFRGGPTYGMDNEDVLNEFGYGQEEIKALYEKGVIKKK